MFEVGQEVFVVMKNRRSLGGLRRIEKVGRRWITIKGGDRFDKGTMLLDGGNHSSPGRVYLSEDEYRQQVLRSKAWNNLRYKVDRQFRPIEGVTIEAMQEAARLLGLGEISYE